MPGSRRALFLDRDGVINIDHGYVCQIEAFEFVAGIFDVARFAAIELGWPIVVVTNQAGIGRGLFAESDFQELTRWMCERFAAEGAPIARVYHCPYHPDAGIGVYRQDHPWRKPKPGMLLQAAADLGLDLVDSILIGDRASDMACAAAAGIRHRICLGSAFDTTGATDAPAHHIVASHAEALALLRGLALPTAPRQW